MRVGVCLGCLPGRALGPSQAMVAGSVCATVPGAVDGIGMAGGDLALKVEALALTITFLDLFGSLSRRVTPTPTNHETSPTRLKTSWEVYPTQASRSFSTFLSQSASS